MTEPSRPKPSRLDPHAAKTRRGGPDRITVALFAAAAFSLLFAFLTLQLSSASTRTGKPVIVRRIYETRVVERAPAGAKGGTSVTQSSSAAYPTAAAPVTGSSR